MRARPKLATRLELAARSTRSASTARLALILVASLAAACGAGATADEALDSQMRMAGGQYVPGTTPASTEGPAVTSLDLKTSSVWPGETGKPIGGTLAPEATAAAIALQGDRGYWIVPAAPPAFAAPTLPTFAATASFAATLAPGPYTLEVRAVDERGAFGPPADVLLTALAAPPSISGPAGALVVALTWDTEADLDLHVVDPEGDEIFHGNPTTLDTFSPGHASADGGGYGYLDVDSNGNCVIDGRRQEDVIWVGPPASGRYLVRVDTPSLCGEAVAHFRVRVSIDGAVIATATGVSLDTDTWGAHDRGAGLLVATFDLP